MECFVEHSVKIQLDDKIYQVHGKKYVKKKCELHFSRAIALCCLSVLKKQTAWKFTAIDAAKDFGLAGVQWRKHLGDDVKICTNVSDNLLEIIKSNFLENCGLVDSENLRIVSENPQAHLHGNKYTFIYAEVYGCAITYFDAVFSSIKHGGLICITSTDTALLQNKSPTTFHRLYDAKMWKTEYHKEFGVRVIIGNLCRAAARWSKGIKVELCAALEPGFTIVCRVFRGSQIAEKSTSYLQNVAHCQLCQARAFVPESLFALDVSALPHLCDCSSNGIKAPVLLLGPVWSGAIYDEGFLFSVVREMRLYQLDSTHIRLIETLTIECACCKAGESEVKLLQKLRNEELEPEEEPPEAKKCKLHTTSDLHADKTASEMSQFDHNNQSNSTSFYFNVQNHSVKGGNPPTVVSVIDQLRKAGFSASKSHFGPRCIKTSANLRVFKDTLQYLWENTKKRIM